MSENRVSGPAYVLGDDIDTDQIIPAQYLAYDPSDPSERRYFGKYALAGVPEEKAGLPRGGMAFTPEGAFESPYRIIVAGRNFGCGSSREHAPLALAESGIQAVIAPFYARIFFRNCVNGGYLLPIESTQRLVDRVQTDDACELDLEAQQLIDHTTGETHAVEPLGDVKPIIDAGGIFAYARAAGMIPGRADG